VSYSYPEPPASLVGGRYIRGGALLRPGQELIAATVGDVPFGNELHLFDTNGRCVVREVLPGMAYGLIGLHSGGRDHLAVLLHDRLLLYP
jgi:hypothetical protein